MGEPLWGAGRWYVVVDLKRDSDGKPLYWYPMNIYADYKQADAVAKPNGCRVVSVHVEGS